MFLLLPALAYGGYAVASDDGVGEIAEHSAPLVAKDSPTAKAPDSASAPSPKAARNLPSELAEIFELSEMISDTAAADFDGALARARANGRTYAALLRQTLREIPDDATAVRSRIVYVLGELGGEDDIETLVEIAEKKLPKLAPGAAGLASDDEEISPVAEVSELRWAAVGALARIAQRHNASAKRGLARLLRTAEPSVAQGAAMELHEMGALTGSHRGTLGSRGIFHAFRKLDHETLYALPPDRRASTPTHVPPPSDATLPDVPNEVRRGQ